MDDTRRRFTIADGMILVAATAAALATAKSFPPRPRSALLPWAAEIPKLTWAGLIFTLALIPIRLRRPRPGRDDLWRRPGWVSCISVAIALAVLLLQESLSFATIFRANPVALFSPGTDLAFFRNKIGQIQTQGIIAIAATWSVLACGGRWESEPGWIDRAGRVIGVYWIVIGLVNWSYGLFV
jgi:hypothetical protein